MRARARYHAPTELAAALDLVADGTVATTVLGGATVVMPRLVRGELAPDQLLDLVRLPGIAATASDSGTTRIGAATSYTTLRRGLPETVPLLARLAAGITGGPQIQNHGTIGGSACHANPASDAPTALVALGAQMVLVSVDAARTISAAEFFTAAFTTSRRDGELLLSVDVPTSPAGDSWGYVKLKRSESSWPIVTAAAQVTPRTATRLVAQITVGGASGVPVTISLALQASRVTADDTATIADLLDGAVDRWYSDDLADDTYRRRVAPVVAGRAVEDALRTLAEGHHT